MDRRRFLSALGASAMVPALPLSALGAPAPAAAVAAGYNRYMYGLAVFHARTGSHVSAADLMARLKLSALQADAMMAEMASTGVLSPASGAVKLGGHHARPRKPYIRKALRQLEALLDQAEPETDENNDAALRRCTGGVQQVHTCHPPASDITATTSSGMKPGVS